MERNVAARRITGTEELLSALGKEEMQQEKKKQRRVPLQPVLFAFFCIVLAAAGGVGFFYIETKVGAAHAAIGTAANDIKSLKAEIAAVDTRERVAALNADIDDLKAVNAQLSAEVQQLRESLESARAKQKTAASPQRKRR